MVTRAYHAYIKSERWKRKREQVFAFYGKRCYACGKREKILHIHHLSYDHFGNEPMADLMPLCVPCHRSVTKIYKRNRRRGLRRVTMEYVRNKKALRG